MVWSLDPSIDKAWQTSQVCFNPNLLLTIEAFLSAAHCAVALLSITIFSILASLYHLPSAHASTWSFAFAACLLPVDK